MRISHDYVAIDVDYLPEMDQLTDEAFGRLIRLAIRYYSTGEHIKDGCKGNEVMLAVMVEHDIDRFIRQGDLDEILDDDYIEALDECTKED